MTILQKRECFISERIYYESTHEISKTHTPDNTYSNTSRTDYLQEPLFSAESLGEVIFIGYYYFITNSYYTAWNWHGADEDNEYNI